MRFTDAASANDDPSVKQFGTELFKYDQENGPSAPDFGDTRFECRRFVQREACGDGWRVVAIVKFNKLTAT